MIKGHGDDSYRYDGIKSDFSSNICKNPAACQAVMDHLAKMPELLGHYPEPKAWSLERIIAQKHKISPTHVVVTSGATEAIYLTAQAFRLKPIIPSPTFSEYKDACNMFPTEDCSRSCLWLCNPNNPDGAVIKRDMANEIIKNHDLVVIDQSYENYTLWDVMSIKKAATCQNVVQIHSMTKTYGVPGLRLGYIITSSPLARQLHRYQRPWSVSSLAIEAGKFLLQHDELMCRPDFDEAFRVRCKLEKMEGISVHQGYSTFMLCELKKGTAAQLKDYLANEHHLLIRDASNFKKLTVRHFRIAIQTPAENNVLLEAIQSYIKMTNG